MLQSSVSSGKTISVLLGWHIIEVVVSGVWVGVSVGDACIKHWFTLSVSVVRRRRRKEEKKRLTCVFGT